MIIDYAKPTDISSLCQLENDSFGIDDFRLSARQFRYHIAKKQVLLATLEGVIAGYLLYFVYPKSLRIYSLAVDKKFRGQKIASFLLLHVNDLAHDWGKTSIFLEVRVDNDRAIAVYQKRGFFKTKVLKNYYFNGIGGLKMQCSVKGCNV